MQNARYIAAGLSDADMRWLLSMGRLRVLAAGEKLVTVAKPIEDLFFVTSGAVSVMTPEGAAIARLHQGDVVGEMSFVDRHPPQVSVVAQERTEVLAIPRKAILARFEQEPVFAARFYRALALFLSERLRDTTAAVRAASEEESLLEKADKAARARFSRLFGKSGP